MLRRLCIKNYVLIDSLEVEFPAGLVIITGQTGAGKSILLGALSLALGSKADASMIGPSGDSCVVEACFDETANDRAAAFAEENDLEWSGGEVEIRRVLNRTGRSRSFLNDCPVSQGVLASLSPLLVDIHSQHDTLLLRDKAFQLSMLDSFAGNGELLSSCAESWKTLGTLRKDLREVKGRLGKAEEGMEWNAAAYEKLLQAGLRDGELEELEAEHRRLANAEEIKSELCQVEALFAPEQGQQPSSAMREASRRLQKVAGFLPQADELALRLDSARLELEDILSEAERMNAGISLDGERLGQVEERMSLLYELMKKHSCSSVTALIALRDELAGGADSLEELKDEERNLQKKIREEEERYGAFADKLRTARQFACGAFTASMKELLASVELGGAAFEACLSEAPSSGTGRDALTLLFSADGGKAVDVAKCASGGEMSRIMLCMKAMMARYADMPLLVFDEIDTGVSGSAAERMGDVICAMGHDMQVFAITHLPQVAAKGDAHFLVSKDGGRSSIRQITGDDRVAELARMLSGINITPEAIANARALLGSAQ